ncbi:hypothetical protein HHK36_016533 [Tetracentron sinense]|uniref:Uncharacterized protein n=1 Tax=Tetracentron sinense TaxID=13715 RepID=A0A834Z3K5_TETSI|nr:hypothetical protein HHK36_016533 [Tetracentron sinense]
MEVVEALHQKIHFQEPETQKGTQIFDRNAKAINKFVDLEGRNVVGGGGFVFGLGIISVSSYSQYSAYVGTKNFMF